MLKKIRYTLYYLRKDLRAFFTGKLVMDSPHGWFGNYKQWDDVAGECTGYDDKKILNSIKTSVLKVRNGEAVYERDSVLFDKIYYSEPLIKAFEKSIIDNKLHIVDFGGSLGSSYFQNKNRFSEKLDLKWSVVEQKHFVEAGKREVAMDNLNFHFTITDALLQQDGQVLFMSSVIPYFKDPYELIKTVINYNFKFIIIDRTAFIEGDAERITKQIVPAFIYKASYPSWFLNEQKFINSFLEKYEMVFDFFSAFDPEGLLEDGAKVYRKGFYFKRKM